MSVSSSYHQEPFVLVPDSVYVPNNSNIFGLLEEIRTMYTDTTTTCVSPIYPNTYLQDMTSFHVDHHNQLIVNESTSSFLDQNSINATTKVTLANAEDPHVSTLKMKHTESSSMVVELQTADQVTQTVTQVEKKREPIHSKVEKEGKCKKLKKCTDDGMSKNRGKEKLKADKKKVHKEAPTGYVHVRARRGQATDNHSLAERERRKKISERMILLQSLVPGCDKVVGKALILEVIINYIQSLQNQVELASLSPKFNDFNVDLHSDKPAAEELLCLEPLLPYVPQSEPIQLWSVNETTPTSTFFHLQHEQRSTIFSEVGGDPLWDINDQTQKLINHYGIN